MLTDPSSGVGDSDDATEVVGQHEPRYALTALVVALTGGASDGAQAADVIHRSEVHTLWT